MLWGSKCSFGLAFNLVGYCRLLASASALHSFIRHMLSVRSGTYCPEYCPAGALLHSKFDTLICIYRRQKATDDMHTHISSTYPAALALTLPKGA